MLTTLKGHTDYVLSLVALPDSTLASSSSDYTIKIWDTLNGKLLKTLTGHTGSVTSLAVLLNNTLASGSGDKTIKIWDTVVKKVLITDILIGSFL